MDAFAEMADADFATETVTVIGGYGAAAGVDLALDRATNRDVPNEAAGLAVAVGAHYAPGLDADSRRSAQIGALGYSGIAMADRLGVRRHIEEAI